MECYNGSSKSPRFQWFSRCNSNTKRFQRCGAKHIWFQNMDNRDRVVVTPPGRFWTSNWSAASTEQILRGHGHEKLHFLCMVQNEVFQTRLLKTHQNTTRKVVPWGKLTQKYWAIDLSTLNRTFIKKFHLCNMSDIGMLENSACLFYLQIWCCFWWEKKCSKLSKAFQNFQYQIHIPSSDGFVYRFRVPFNVTEFWLRA